MTVLLAELTKVRETLEDIEAGAYRVADARMVDYANDFVRELCLVRPDLFSTIGDITCTAGTCLQSAPAGAIVLVDVFQVKTGRTVTETKRHLLDRFNSNWWNDTAAAAKNWIRHEKDPLKFFIYPKAPVSQILVGQWAQLPSLMTVVGDTIPSQVLDVYLPAMHHYLCFRALARPENKAKAELAPAFYQAAMGLITAGAAAKADAEEAKDGN